MMNVARLTKNGQTTIPIEIRNLLALHSGDRLLFEINENKKVTLKKISPFDAEFAIALESTLDNEWNSDQDNEAYNDL
jgi:AbrB family looped-hinge helix DNA binding protein